MTASETDKFKVIVVGAGIAGLCAAVGLAQQGHEVIILESAHELTPTGIGLHIPPNATRVLEMFGLLKTMEEDAIHPTTFHYHRWNGSSSPIASFPAKQSVQSGFPYWTMRRSDYQRHLHEATKAAGCQIRLSSRVESIDLEKTAVALETGEHIFADLVVVADGVKSKIRGQVIPEVDTSMVLNRLSSYRAYANKKDLMSDPVTAPLFQQQATNVWLGYNRHFIIYPCSGDLYTIGATHLAGEHEAMSWTASATSKEAQEAFADFSPVVTRILAHAGDIKQWRLAEIPRLPRWTSQSGRVVLLGDAAHGMLQFLAQGAAMATEDAASLALCIGRAKSSDDIPAVLEAYERSRKWRCEVVQAGARRNGDVIHMPDGEEQEQRDLALKGHAQTGLWKADPGPLMDETFRSFLYGHNVIEHTNNVLETMGL